MHSTRELQETRRWAKAAKHTSFMAPSVLWRRGSVTLRAVSCSQALNTSFVDFCEFPDLLDLPHLIPYHRPVRQALSMLSRLRLGKEKHILEQLSDLPKVIQSKSQTLGYNEQKSKKNNQTTKGISRLV